MILPTLMLMMMQHAVLSSLPNWTKTHSINNQRSNNNNQISTAYLFVWNYIYFIVMRIVVIRTLPDRRPKLTKNQKKNLNNKKKRKSNKKKFTPIQIATRKHSLFSICECKMMEVLLFWRDYKKT